MVPEQDEASDAVFIQQDVTLDDELLLQLKIFALQHDNLYVLPRKTKEVKAPVAQVNHAGIGIFFLTTDIFITSLAFHTWVKYGSTI